MTLTHAHDARTMLEDLVAAARPAWSVEHVDGWQLRHTPQVGWRVLNCVRPPLRPGRPVSATELEAIRRRADAFYRARDCQRPACYRVTQAPEHTALDQVLAGAGYHATSRTAVLTVPLPMGGLLAAGSAADVHVSVQAQPSEDWMPAWALPDRPFLQTLIRRLYARIPPPTAYFLARTGEGAAGFAMASVHEGIAFGSTLSVHPALRRRGIACALYAAGQQWALDQNAHALCVEVEGDSASMALCRKLGFSPSHWYHYRHLPRP